MADNVLDFTGDTSRVDSLPETILEDAQQADLLHVVVIGVTGSDTYYFNASQADGAEVLWLLALAQKKLLELGDPE